MAPSGAQMVDEYPETLQILRQQGAHGTQASSDEDELRAKTSQQQAKNDQLFVTIRKRYMEDCIIEQIEECLNNGAEINALNSRGKTVLDIAHQKNYEAIIKLLIERGGKTARELAHGENTGLENIEVNSINGQSTNTLIADQQEIRDLQDKQLSTNIDVYGNRRDLHAFLLKEGKNILTEKKLEKLNAILESGLEIQEVIKSLIQYGINQNYQDPRTRMTAVNIAWEYGYYNVMLTLLEAGCKFPKDFSVNALYENNDIPENLLSFVKQRQELYSWIRNCEFQKVQQFFANHHLSIFFNCEGECALQVAAEYAHVDTLASLVALLSISAKNGKKENLDFVLKCSVHINHRNKYSECAVDLAWYTSHYDIVHILLKADLDFPRKFNLEALNAENAIELRKFVERRNKFHELIKDNRLIEMKQFTATDKSKLYLNSDGESALATSLIMKRFEIYAYLKSIGLTFKTEDEEDYITKLPIGEKDILKIAMIREFPQIDKGYILYLLSKSRSKTRIENFKERVENVYRKLDTIPEVSIVLQVLQYTDYLDIIFDFESENIKDINPTASETTRGTTDYKDGRIYIAARTDLKKLAGTLSHELAHLVIYIIYKNECNPFDKVGTSRRRFDEITAKIKEYLKEIVVNMNGFEDSPVATLARAFNYPADEQQSELIVRVPHILAQYSAAGRNLLMKHDNFKLLFDYYNDQEEGGLLYRCKEVIQNNFLIKPRKSIQLLNETVGYIDDVIKDGIHFEDCIDLNIFLKDEKQVFLLETDSVLLSALNVFESLTKRNKNYSLQDSFFLEFSSYIEKEDEILKLFFSSAGKLLCLSHSCDLNIEQLSHAFNIFKELLNQKPEKKIIFIVQQSQTKVLDKITCTFKNNYEKSTQQRFTLNSLTKESQQKLLEREITFQEESIPLNKFIDMSDNNAKKVIDTHILVKLIKNERIEIGCKPPDTSNLEGAYSEVFQEVDMNTFIDKLLEQTSSEVYVISGLSGSNKQAGLIKSLLNHLKDIDNISKVNHLVRYIDVLDIQDVARNIDKCIQVTCDKFKVKHFKEICHKNSAMKIYWIHFRNDIGDSKFILQLIYNPDFYLTGKRINREVVIEKSVIEELLSSKLTERFIISMNQKNDIQKWLQLNSGQKDKLMYNMQNNRITFVYLQDDTEDYFPESVKANQILHLLKFKDDHLIWYKTYGSSNILNKHRAKDYKNIEPLIEENDAIKIIQNNKVAIIAGDPGTGKSTIITRLYTAKCLTKAGQQVSIMKSHWVIKVNLKDHIPIIKDMTFNNNDLSEITEFLLQAEKYLTDNPIKTFAQGLLCMSLHKNYFEKPLLIAFDGFDEVLDTANRNKIISLLKYLKDKTYAQFCITTRLHYEEDLEDALSTFAIRLEPMDDLTIRKFIAKSFSNRLSLKISQNKFAHFFANNGKGMLKYTNAFLRKMQEVFLKNISKFIGTPLQLYLLLENADDSFQEWMNDVSKNPDFRFLGNDIWEVYEIFIDKKYYYFSKTKTGEKEKMLQQEDNRHLDKYHMDLAKSIIFKSDTNEFHFTLHYIHDIILFIGIVRSQGNHLGFIHPTFAEYFAAKALVYWIRKWKKDGFINFTKQKYFFLNILQKSDYRVVRAFLNAKLLKEEDYSFDLVHVYYHEDIVRLAAQENHVGIAKFVLDNFPNVDVNVSRYSESLLNMAVKAGLLKIVKLLIQKGADVNAVTQRVETALTLAAQSGHLEITKLLIDNGADVNAVGNPPFRTLTHACQCGHLEIVKLLIDKGADVNAVDILYQTALFYACQRGYLEIIKLLIDKGADVNARYDYRGTPFIKTAASGHLEVMKLLIDKGADVNGVGNLLQIALFDACQLGDLEIIEFLIDKGADVNVLDQHGVTPLLEVVAFGHLKVTKFLIDKGADVNVVDNSCRTALFSACQRGHLEIVKLLIDKGTDFNAVNDRHRTALFYACKRGHLEIVKLLIDKGANVIARDQHGATPLTLAAVFGHLAITKLLIQKGADVNAVTQRAETALTSAAGSGHLEITKLLIDNGADVNAVGSLRLQALTHACRSGHLEIVKLLIDKGAVVNDRNHSGTFPLIAAAKFGHLEITKLLIDKSADDNALDILYQTALFYACQRGHLEIIKLLIDKGANINARYDYKEKPLIKAAASGHLEVMKLLIDKGADVNRVGNLLQIALFDACQLGDLEIIEFLIDKGADVNVLDQHGVTPLLEVVAFGHLKITKFLIDKGADVNVVDNSRQTALFSACQRGHLEIVKLLIDKGTDFNAVNDRHRTALFYACKRGHLKIVKLLIEKGANVIARDQHGATPLTLAAVFGHLAITKLLIQKGADVNARYDYRGTPLIKAAASGHLEVMKLLIDKGADVNAVDEWHQTALIHACNFGHLEIVKLLLDKGADSTIVNQNGKTALLVADEFEHSDIVTLLKTHTQYHHLTTFNYSFEDSGRNGVI